MPPLSLPDPELADDTIRLRAPAADDVPAITEACQDPDIQYFTFVPVPYREQDARDWVDGAAARAASGEALSLVIADDRAKLLGTVGLLRPDWVKRTVSIKGRTWNLVSYSLRPAQVTT
jgi:RimJ/RimL family protein N-acetyltransferase